MFDTIAGLPLHPLLVHAVVVLLPLMCLITVAAAFWAPLRRQLRLVVLGNVLVFGAAFAAKEAGENLLRRVTDFGPASADLNTHTQWGDRLPWLALSMVVISVIVWFVASRQPSLVRWAGVLAAVGALSTIGVTVLVGDTGARAVWSSVVSNSK